ncbi:MAG: TRAP transporter small permease [Zhengella sp.]|uniref:TRAP transporter small permease subunit n=1 Tax=Zhengella sp. TaxID=2282762 RepID=UPI001DF09AFF|nr:TRAP transporter small permease [Notoacmeibacter sp.]
MEKQSLWLGGLRKPMRWLAIGFGALTLLLFIYFVLGHFVSETPVTMYEMIRPAGRPLVQAMLVCLFATILFASIYLSDFRGAIERAPEGFFDIVALVCSRIAMVGTLLIVIAMFYEVVARYVFTAPTLWANELSLWIASFVFLLAGLYAMQQRSHIRIYVIYDLMPRWMQKTADVISVLLIAGFTFTLIWGGYNDASVRMMRGETFGTAWDPPIPASVKPAILFIILLVTIQAVSNLIADWNRAPEHHSPMDEIDEVEIENIRKTLKD